MTREDVQSDTKHASDSKEPAAADPTYQVERDQADRTPDRKNIFLVGIGASAGGLEALERFFDEMPSNSGMAFAVIQHLSPDYRSLMVELLSKHTKMQVQRAESDMPMEPNCVYLIPPRTTMTIHDGKLQLVEQDRHSGLHLPIDVFFRSLGEDQGEKGIGIVLSGTGSDGVRGIRTIKDKGGMVMVQSLSDAKFDGMPRSAISTGLADFVLPVEQMPQALVQFVTNPAMFTGSDGSVNIEADDQQDFQRVLGLIRKHTGVDFTFYKPATVIRRIERRMSITQCRTLTEYADLLVTSPKEISTLYREMLIGVTKFFRDADAFEVISDQVIPAIFEQSDDDIRIWVAGCSTGEEAYSLAMILQDYIETHQISREVKVFATDLDKSSVAFAAEGVYPESVVADLSPKLLNRFFVKHGEHYRICRQIRERVIFAPHNLIKDPPFSNMDLVACRNLLIYLQPNVQNKVLAVLAYALKHQGYLLLGPSETPGNVANVFAPVDSKWKIYRKMASNRNLIGETLFLHNQKDRQDTRPTATTEPAYPTSQDGPRDNVLEKTLQEVMLARDTGCLILDSNYHVAQLFGDVEDLIQFRPGKTSLDARNVTRGELSVALSTALSRATKTLQEVCYSRVSLNKTDARINLRVRPFQLRRNDLTWYLVLLERVAPPSEQNETAAETEQLDTETRNRIQDLEQELQFTRANLQATIEELQTSNEELQATNEELVASNEELQSTNEELQSVNEELHTVNTEYQEKIQELTQLNNDMDNFLRTTRIGTIFLDRDLRIRKFTSPVAELLNVLPQDVGRPISHLTGSLEGVDLPGLARKTMLDSTSYECEARAEGKKAYLVRSLPYLTDEDSLDGVVLTFMDVTELKQAQGEAQQAGMRLRGVASTIHESLMSIALPSGRVEYASPPTREQLGVEPEALVESEDPWKLIVDPRDLQRVRDYIQALPTTGARDCTFRTNAPGAPQYIQMHSHIIQGDGDRPQHIDAILRDVTVLRQSPAILSGLVDAQQLPTILCAEDGQIIYAAEPWRTLAGENDLDLTPGRHLAQALDPADDGEDSLARRVARAWSELDEDQRQARVACDGQPDWLDGRQIQLDLLPGSGAAVLVRLLDDQG